MKLLKNNLVLPFILILAIVIPVAFETVNIFGDCIYRDRSGQRCDSGSTTSTTDTGKSGKSDQGGSSIRKKNGGGSTTPTTPDNDSDDGSENSGDSGGGGSTSTTPPPPSPEQIAAADARAKASAAEELGNTANNESTSALSEADEKKNLSQDGTTGKGNTIANPSVAGDPVLASSGSFVFEVEDYEIPGSGFGVKRKYLSGEKILGSMGNGWLSSLDSRIIRGKTVISADSISQLESLVSRILE